MKIHLKKFAEVVFTLILTAGFFSCKNETEIKIEYVDKTYVSTVTFAYEDLEEGSLKIDFSTSTENAEIFYTTDGTIPTKNSIKYTEPVTFTNDVVIKAFAVKEGMENSPISVAVVSIIKKTIAKYICPNDKKEFATAEEAANCCGVRVEEVEKLIYTSAVSETGVYSVYHLQQKTTGGKSISDYVLADEENITLEKNSLLEDVMKSYKGFTAKVMSQNENVIYVFYDRNKITYTFNTGKEGKFIDGTTSKEISGLYGENLKKFSFPKSIDYYFISWKDESDNNLPLTFDAVDKEFNAVWQSKKECRIFNDDTFVKINYSGSECLISSTELIYADWYEVYQWAIKEGYVFENSGREGSDGIDGAEPDANKNQPVTCVSWRDAVIWCNAASEKAGLKPVYGVNLKDVKFANDASVNANANGYRLPGVLEWKYAAAGGQNFIYSGSDNIDDVAWYIENSDNRTKDAGEKEGNCYGLYDMCGNVWEWCEDTWIEFGEDNDPKVYIGGSWNSKADDCIIPGSDQETCGDIPTFKGNNLGFRVCRTLQ